MLENGKDDSFWKISNLYTYWGCGLTYLPMLLWWPHNNIDLVVAGDESIDKDLVTLYLGYYDWDRGVQPTFVLD